MMRIFSGPKLITAFFAGVMAASSICAKEPKAKEIYGPPDENAPPAGVFAKRPYVPQRMKPLLNKFERDDMAVTEEIADGVYGTVKPVQIRISVPFDLRR